MWAGDRGVMAHPKLVRVGLEAEAVVAEEEEEEEEEEKEEVGGAYPSTLVTRLRVAALFTTPELPASTTVKSHMARMASTEPFANIHSPALLLAEDTCAEAWKEVEWGERGGTPTPAPCCCCCCCWWV